MTRLIQLDFDLLDPAPEWIEDLIAEMAADGALADKPIFLMTPDPLDHYRSLAAAADG